MSVRLSWCSISSASSVCARRIGVRVYDAGLCVDMYRYTYSL